MTQSKTARQPRGDAITGPDAERCDPASSRVDHNASGRNLNGAGDRKAASVAETLLGVTMWLASARDWIEEELELRRMPATGSGPDAAPAIMLAVTDVERMHNALGRAVALLDALAIDPADIQAARPPSQSREVLRVTLQ